MVKMKPRDKLMAKALIKTKGNQGKAYKLLHPNVSDEVAQASASRLLSTKPHITEFVVERLNNKGVSIDTLVGGLKKQIRAKKENIMPSGEVVKTVDNTARMTAIRTGFQLHGALQQSTNINTDKRSININLAGRESKELNSLTSKLDDLHKALALDSGAQDGEIVDADFSTTDDTISLD